MSEKQKPAVREIINLQEISNQKTNYDHQAFVSDLANQCGNFLSWITNRNSNLCAENAWKNEMRTRAAEIYPELEIDEVKRLVDRDWRIMSEENRNQISKRYEQCRKEQQISQKLSLLRESINSLKSNSK